MPSTANASPPRAPCQSTRSTHAARLTRHHAPRRQRVGHHRQAERLGHLLRSRALHRHREALRRERSPRPRADPVVWRWVFVSTTFALVTLRCREGCPRFPMHAGKRGRGRPVKKTPHLITWSGRWKLWLPTPVLSRSSLRWRRAAHDPGNACRHCTCYPRRPPSLRVRPKLPNLCRCRQ